VRLMPDDLRTKHLREMARVAAVVATPLSRADQYQRRCQLAGWSWASIDEVCASAARAGLVQQGATEFAGGIAIRWAATR
jgi:hypothetical protein